MPTTIANVTSTSASAAVGRTSFTRPPASTPGAGLSLGAKAGIGVSIPVAALSFAAFGFWMFFRRKNKYQPEHRGNEAEYRGSAEDFTDESRYADLPELVVVAAPKPVSNTTNPTNVKTKSSRGPEVLPTKQVGPEASPSMTDVTNTTSLPTSSTPQADYRVTEEIARIQAEQASLQERRQRLLELNRLDDEEQRPKQELDKKLSQVGGGR